MWKTWFDYNRSATKVCSKHPFRFSNRTTKVEVTGRRSSLRVTLQIVNQNFTIRFVADPGSISKRWVASWPLSAHSHIQQVDIHCHLDNTNQIFQTVRSYKCSIVSRLIFQLLHVVCCGATQHANSTNHLAHGISKILPDDAWSPPTLTGAWRKS